MPLSGRRDARLAGHRRLDQLVQKDGRVGPRRDAATWHLIEGKTLEGREEVVLHMDVQHVRVKELGQGVAVDSGRLSR